MKHIFFYMYVWYKYNNHNYDYQMMVYIRVKGIIILGMQLMSDKRLKWD